MNKKAATLYLLLVGGLILSGCASGDGSSGGEGADPTMRPPEGEPDLLGDVCSVEGLDDSSSPTRVLVQQRANSLDEGSAENTSGEAETCTSGTAIKGKQPRLYLIVNNQTRVLRQEQGANGASLASAEVTDLEKGQSVRAWHGEVISRSYPGQAQAEAIVIERGSE